MKLFLALVTALALAVLVLQLRPAPAARQAGCAKRVYVTFFVYSTFPPPKNTPCWSYERPPQNLARWHICHWNKPTNGSGSSWIYDDTSPAHRPARAESVKVAKCASSGGPLGYEAMARKNGVWRRVVPRGVTITRFYAETYSGESTVADYFGAWLARPSIGSPVVNIGPASLSATYGSIFRACRAIAPGVYMGVYSSRPVTAANGKLTQLQKALNACTTRV